jgi:hypothetical protein
MAKKTPVNRPGHYVFGRPTKYTEGIYDQLNEYFKLCKKDEKLPTAEGLAVYTQIGLRTLQDWTEKYDDFSHAYEYLMNYQAETLLNGSLKGEYNATISKMMLSANHGYVERKDITSAGKEMKSFNFEMNEPSKGHQVDSNSASS